MRKDSGVMNQTVELTTPLEDASAGANRAHVSSPSNVGTASSTLTTAGTTTTAGIGPAMEQSSEDPDSEGTTATTDPAPSDMSKTVDPAASVATSSQSESSTSEPEEAGTNESAEVNESAIATPSADATTIDQADGAKKTRAPRVPKAPTKPVEAAGSITTIVERVVRMTTLSDEHSAALARLFNVSLPEDYVARLTRLTAASLGPIGSGAAESLTIVLGLESTNPIHVGVQLGRLAPTSLPDVYRCAHALTGETAPALPKGDTAVFAVADVLATLTTSDFALAKALSAALE